MSQQLVEQLGAEPHERAAGLAGRHAALVVAREAGLGPERPGERERQRAGNGLQRQAARGRSAYDCLQIRRDVPERAGQLGAAATARTWAGTTR